MTEWKQSRTNHLQRKARLRMLVSLLLIGTTLTGITAATYLLIRNEYLLHARTMEQQAVILYQSIIGSHFRHFTADLDYLSGSMDLANWLTAAESPPSAAIIERFRNLSRSHDVYDSISVLAMDGQGLLRVENRSGTIRVVLRDALPDYARANFFRKILAGDRRSIYISPFGHGDGEVPNGEPHDAVIRLVAPVRHPGGELLGLIVMNYNGADFTSRLRQSADISLGDLMLLDAEGNWLVFPYDNRPGNQPHARPEDAGFGKVYPQVWLAMLTARSGQFASRHGLFTFASLHPYAELLETRSAQQGVHLHDAAAAYRLSVVSFIPQQRLSATLDPIRGRFIALNVALLLLAALASWQIGHSYLKRQEALLDLQNAAHFDFLTRLANRTLFMREFDHALRHARRYDQILALLLLDLDNFKSINDRFGHEAGDRFLKETARRLNHGVRDSDLVARIGGDEFTVILNGISSAGDAEQIAEKLLHNLNRPFTLGDEHRGIRCSIGMAIFPGDGETIQQLQIRADQSMYRVKKAGGNGVAKRPFVVSDCNPALPGQTQHPTG